MSIKHKKKYHFCNYFKFNFRYQMIKTVHSQADVHHPPPKMLRSVPASAWPTIPSIITAINALRCVLLGTWPRPQVFQGVLLLNGFIHRSQSLQFEFPLGFQPVQHSNRDSSDTWQPRHISLAVIKLFPGTAESDDEQHNTTASSKRKSSH